MVDANKRVVQRWVDAWNASNLDAIDELFADDFVDRTSFSMGEDARGLAGFKQRLAIQRAAMGAMQFEIHDVIAEGDRVVIRWTARGVHQSTLFGAPPTGAALAIPGLNIFRVANAKIVERWTFIDQQTVMRQISPPTS
jgi:steroid delta-isomerase-like uncharacterized protein